jgi:type IV pilus assembly protein PilE
VPGSLKQSPADGSAIYRLEITNPTAVGYELEMIPISDGSMADDDCGAFTLTSTGVRGVFVSNAVGSEALRNTCWK